MRRRLPESIALAVAGAILIAILLVPPPVGLADDGDFPKVTRLFDFDANAPDDGDRWYKYIFLDYKFDKNCHWWSGFPSSEMLLVGYLADVLDSLRLLFLFNATMDILAMGCLATAVAERLPPEPRELRPSVSL